MSSYAIASGNDTKDSIWLYIPLTTDDENRLAHAEPSDLLGGLVFGSSAPRYATIGIAKDYRLVFEREWHIPQDTDPQRVLADVLGFLLDALTIALTEDMPPAAASSSTRHLKSSASS